MNLFNSCIRVSFMKPIFQFALAIFSEPIIEITSVTKSRISMNPPHVFYKLIPRKNSHHSK